MTRDTPLRSAVDPASAAVDQANANNDTPPAILRKRCIVLLLSGDPNRQVTGHGTDTPGHDHRTLLIKVPQEEKSEPPQGGCYGRGPGFRPHRMTHAIPHRGVDRGEAMSRLFRLCTFAYCPGSLCLCSLSYRAIL